MKVSFIIPFHNEGERLNDVIDVISKVKNIDKIILVDDGSSTFTAKRGISGANKFKNDKIEYLKLSRNIGKAGAIWEGLKKTRSDYIFLCDGDVRGLKAEEIERAIEAIINNETLDMIILRRMKAKLESQWIRADTIFSGERILRRSDLMDVYETNPTGYQIEIAINTYMIKNKKNVYWMPSSGVNVFKRDKVGLIEGTIKEQTMHLSMMRYAGFLNYLKQTLFFCRKEFKKF